jgi:hypothetical protein
LSGLSGARIDIALGGGMAVAVMKAARSTHRATVSFALPAEPEGAASTIAATLQALGDRLAESAGSPIERPHGRVALLPPLADVRLVPLPPLRPSEAEAVLRRDAGRYFLGDPVPRVIGVLPGARPSNRGVLAAASPVSLCEAIRSAFGFAGWTLDGIVPAHGAWMAAASSDHSAATPTHAILAVDRDAVHVIRIENGNVTVVRRVAITSLGALVEAAGPGPGAATVFASRSERDPFVKTLSAAGWMVAGSSIEPMSASDAAAEGAVTSAIELVPPTLAAQRRDGKRRTALRIAAASVLLVIAAGIVELWGANRELDAVRTQRATIHEQVAPLLADRDSVQHLLERSLAIESLELESPRWTRAFFDLALLLPRDTHITLFRATGDTMLAEATGARASAALQALGRAGSLRNVRLVGAVERVLEDGETATERFRFTAELTPMLGPDGVTPKANAMEPLQHDAQPDRVTRRMQ